MNLIKFRVCLLVALIFCASALAHKPLLSVDDNEDGTIYIEVGFSDGSSGAGHDIIFKGMDGKVLNELKVPDESSIDVDMPAVPYTVTFFAGAGHEVTMEGPFAEKLAGDSEGEQDSVETTRSVSSQAPVPTPSVQEAKTQPVVMARSCTNCCSANNAGSSRGFDMALKMMITTNIIIAVLAAFLLATCAFAVGYNIGKSK